NPRGAFRRPANRTDAGKLPKRSSSDAQYHAFKVPKAGEITVRQVDRCVGKLLEANRRRDQPAGNQAGRDRCQWRLRTHPSQLRTVARSATRGESRPRTRIEP